VDISAEFVNAIAAGCPRLTQIDLEQAFSVDASALINPRPQAVTIIPPHSI
jgi:hypothetical protein